MHTGDIIKFLRKSKRMTQEELATLLGVKKSSVQKYECGKVQNLKLEKIQKLCNIFEITPYALVFPEIWQEKEPEQESVNTLFKYTRIYFHLTEEGQQKILDYIEDIGDVAKYQRKNVSERELAKTTVKPPSSDVESVKQ